MKIHANITYSKSITFYGTFELNKSRDINTQKKKKKKVDELMKELVLEVLK
jgi:hypothetical protein